VQLAAKLKTLLEQYEVREQVSPFEFEKFSSHWIVGHTVEKQQFQAHRQSFKTQRS
jgi:hypothetical protein